jgi:AcrR family transcriptional regulator
MKPAPDLDTKLPRILVTLSAIVNIMCHRCHGRGRVSGMTPLETTSSRRKAKPFARAVPPGAKSLAQRKQEVVRRALAAAAEELFVSRGFEQTTVEQIAHAAGVSRRTFFRYFESKDDVLADHADRLGERLYAELAVRPSSEAPLEAIRNAMVPAAEAALQGREVLRAMIRLLRETNSVRRVVLARQNRLEERVAALMAKRLKARPADNTPMLLAFLTRALLDTAFNAWYDHETTDVAGLIDDLVRRLTAIVTSGPPGASTIGRGRAVSRPPRR